LLASLLLKLIINLISWYYYSCSAHDCVSRRKNSARSLVNLKMYIKSHKKL